MKQKLKVKLLIILSISLLFLNCEKDDQIVSSSNHINNSKEKIKTIYKEEILNNQRISSMLEKVNKSIEKNKINRNIYSPEFDFYINTDYATYIESEDGIYHSYTFPLFRDVYSSNIENLVFSLNPDGSYKTVLITYNLTPEEKEKIINGVSINLENKISSIEIDGTSLESNIFGKEFYAGGIGDCLGYVVTETSYCGCNEPSHATNLTGCQCIETTYDREYFGCGGSGGGGTTGTGTGTSGSGTGTSGGSTYSGGSGGTGSNPVVSSPTPVDYAKLREKCFSQNNPETSNWLNQPENADIKIEVIQYLEDSVNHDELQSTESCYPQEEVDKVVFLRNLITELNNNPNLLLDIPCNQLPNWLQIAQYNLPQSVLDKVSNLQSQNSGAVPNWDIQSLYGAQGTIVNMDFFPVTISQFPTNPNTNLPYTPQEFYNFFRLNLNLFTQSAGVSFQPSTITGVNESVIWNSNNPINSILSINMQPDSGSVICSNYTNNYWYFTTLTTPWAFSWSQDDYDGFHPVSGHREFGYYQTVNGNYVFFVRGVDRIQRAAVFTIAQMNPNWDSPFTPADQKWNAMQENLKNYVEAHGGVATINMDNIYRPNWNDIKDVLNGIKPLSDLGCN